MKAKAQQKVQYDKTSKEYSFSVGDLVMVRDNVSVHGKLSLPFRGPWKITELTPTNAVMSMKKGPKTAVKKCTLTN